MTSLDRRTIIKGVMLVGSCGAGALPLVSSFSTQGSSGVRELNDILAYWFEREAVLPSTYLSGLGVNIYDVNSADIKLHIEADFRTGNVMSINGLVLSKTEVALLSECAIVALA